MSISGETKELTTTATLEDGGVKSTPSLASRLNQRADLLRCIFSFHKTKNPKHYINLRSSSKFFHRALQLPPLWTSFPNSNHATLQSLIDRLEQLRGDKESSGNVPSVLFIEEGDVRPPNNGDWYVTVKIPLSIYGGREKTRLVGVGLKIEGEKNDGIVVIEDLTIQGPKNYGLFAYKGMNMIIRGCEVADGRRHGVVADGADISCDDLQVVGCSFSGVCVYDNATITLSGQGTSVRGNVTAGDSDEYAIDACGMDTSTSKFQLVAPLTNEQISTNNNGGGNWGGGSIIEQIDNDGVVLQILYEPYVPGQGQGTSDDDY